MAILVSREAGGRFVMTMGNTTLPTPNTQALPVTAPNAQDIVRTITARQAARTEREEVISQQIAITLPTVVPCGQYPSKIIDTTYGIPNFIPFQEILGSVYKSSKCHSVYSKGPYNNEFLSACFSEDAKTIPGTMRVANAINVSVIDQMSGFSILEGIQAHFAKGKPYFMLHICSELDGSRTQFPIYDALGYFNNNRTIPRNAELLVLYPYEPNLFQLVNPTRKAPSGERQDGLNRNLIEDLILSDLENSHALLRSAARFKEGLALDKPDDAMAVKLATISAMKGCSAAKAFLQKFYPNKIAGQSFPMPKQWPEATLLQSQMEAFMAFHDLIESCRIANDPVVKSFKVNFPEKNDRNRAVVTFIFEVDNGKISTTFTRKWEMESSSFEKLNKSAFLSICTTIMPIVAHFDPRHPNHESAQNRIYYILCDKHSLSLSDDQGKNLKEKLPEDFFVIYDCPSKKDTAWKIKVHVPDFLSKEEQKLVKKS